MLLEFKKYGRLNFLKAIIIVELWVFGFK